LAGFEEMRELFQEDIRKGQNIFPDRARILQEASRRGQLDQLYIETAHSLRQNLEARQCYVLGVGIA
jgi:hypothetical protein